MNLLLAHGGGSGAHADAARELAGRVAAVLGEEVRAAFLNEAPGAALRGARVVPLFLTEGQHRLADAPAWARKADAMLLQGLEAEALARMAAELADAARERSGAGRRAARGVLLALHRLRGARALMAALYARSRRWPLPAVVGLHGECLAADVLALWRAEGLEMAVAQPVLWLPGRNLECLREIACASGLQVFVGEPLARHADAPALLADCFRCGEP